MKRVPNILNPKRSSSISANIKCPSSIVNHKPFEMRTNIDLAYLLRGAVKKMKIAKSKSRLISR